VDRANVTTVDIDADLVAAARLGLDRAGYTDVETICGDGWAGYPPNAPYDRIILTVRAADIAPAWLDQLTPAGRLILPLDVWAGAQYSIAFQRGQFRNVGDILVSTSAHPCGFMPLRGESMQISDEMNHLTGDKIVVSQFNPVQTDRAPLSLPQVFGLLKRAYEDYSSGVSMTAHEFYGGGFWLWLASRDPSACFVRAGGDWVHRVPAVNGKREEVITTAGLISEHGLALLSRENAGDERGAQDVRRGAIKVRRWGEDDLPTRKLIAVLRAWERAGRPTGDNLRVAAYPADRDIITPRDTVLIRKPNFHYLLKWK
jgi:protein-L-isoaspartate(D-aspartate) O-methyltransferase